MSGSVRIGSSSAAGGDAAHTVRQLVARGDLDYLVSNCLEDVTMAVLARAKASSPDAGYTAEWLASIRPLLADIHRKGIRLVTNAGGLNPRACRASFLAAAAEAGLDFRVAIVTGDDLLPMLGAIQRAGVRELATDEPLPGELASINADLGAPGIVEALKAGADVVITGQVAASALVLGPLMAAFSWDAEDYDLLAAGSLAGHVVGGGAGATGGLHTDWVEVADGWPDMGSAIVDCERDGSFTVTKADGTGGMVTTGTVAEQIVDTIGDPQAYHMPDVCCDLSRVRLEQVGPDRVRVTGATGRAPGGDYRVSAVEADGFKLASTMLVAGWQAGRRGQRAAESIITRAGRLLAETGHTPFREVSIDVIGSEDSYRPAQRAEDSREAVIRIGLRHDDASALGLFSREVAHAGAVTAQGVSSMSHGTAEPAMRVRPFLWPKHRVPVALDLEGEIHAVVVGETDEPGSPVRPAVPASPGATAFTVAVPLRAIALGRSGGEDGDAHIGLIARQADFYAQLVSQVTEAKVAGFFAHHLKGDVERFLLPGLNAVSFVLHDALGGSGTASLRSDPRGKGYAPKLLDLSIDVPADWLEHKGPLAGWRDLHEVR